MPDRVRYGFAPRQAHVRRVAGRCPPQCDRRVARRHAFRNVLGARTSARAIHEARVIHRATPRHVVGMFLREPLHCGAACPRLDSCKQQHEQSHGELHVILLKPSWRIISDLRRIYRLKRRLLKGMNHDVRFTPESGHVQWRSQ